MKTPVTSWTRLLKVCCRLEIRNHPLFQAVFQPRWCLYQNLKSLVVPCELHHERRYPEPVPLRAVLLTEIMDNLRKITLAPAKQIQLLMILYANLLQILMKFLKMERINVILVTMKVMVWINHPQRQDWILDICHLPRKSANQLIAEEEDDDPDVYCFESDHAALKHNKDYQRLLQMLAVFKGQHSQAM